MAKLTHGVEIELQRHMDNLELRVQKAADAVQSLEPELESLRAKLAAIEKHITHDLDSSIQRSGNSVNHGLEDADQLQRMLAVMIHTILDSHSHLTAAQENSVALAEIRDADLRKWAAVMATATASAQSLNNEIVRGPWTRLPCPHLCQ